MWKRHDNIAILLAMTGVSFCAPSVAEASRVTACFVQALSALTGPSVKSDDMVWVDGRLSDAQFENLRKFSSKTNRPIRPGYRVEILSAKEIASRKEPFESVGANSAADWLLLAKSNVETGPREVMRFRLHFGNGEVLDPNIEVIGNARNLDFSQGEAQLDSLLRGNAFGIDEIEIVHSHPYHAVRITDASGQRYFRPANLSNEDIQVAAEYARRFPPGKKVTVKAVTPAGVNFSASFPTGR